MLILYTCTGSTSYNLNNELFFDKYMMGKVLPLGHLRALWGLGTRNMIYL